MTQSVRLLKRRNTPSPFPDQKEAIDQYFKIGRVCVDAGAGTGKTFTLIEIATEAIIRQLNADVYNPFERMLLVSFGVEASRQLKNDLKRRLEDHEAAGGSLPPRIWRLLETQSNIKTIDALIRSMLREIAVQTGISLSFDIQEGLGQEQVLRTIFDQLRSERQLASAWDNLEAAYPDSRVRYGPENVERMIWSTHQKTQEFCWKIDDIQNKLLESLRDMHGGKQPPFAKTDLHHIVSYHRGNTAVLSNGKLSDAELINLANQTYKQTEGLIADFFKLLKRFDKEYWKRARKTGKFTYIDLAYLVSQFMNNTQGKGWKVALSQRFDHLLIDEYQDTSFVQNEILSTFIRNHTKNDTKVLIIGDVKQSIYQWRTAEPRIFDELIQNLSQPQPKFKPPFYKMSRRPLVTNFRSHSELIKFFNATFSKLFFDNTRGKIAGSISYENLDPFYTKTIDASESRIHVLLNPGKSKKYWLEHEPCAIRSFISETIKPGLLEVRAKGAKDRSCQLGDVALLFRRRTNIPFYVTELRNAGIKCAVLADISLFEEAEISLIIDILDWFANPDSKDSLLRILRSPVTALSDETLRYLVSRRLFLDTALNNWPRSELPDGDKTRLQNLVNLRNDLRWDREGPKADLVSKLISHSYLDCIVSAGENGLQAQANLWLLMDVVAAWEEEELLTYRDFVNRLIALRERADREAGKDYPRAIIADETSSDCVKIMTVHAAKGLEFPIVILPDTIVQTGTMTVRNRMVRNRTHGISLKPRPPRTRIAQEDCVFSQPNKRFIKWATPGSGESLLWTSTERDENTGQLLARGRHQWALKDEQAEFWRLLYVAATRARDHLVFSITPEFQPRGKGQREFPWTSWMPFLKDAVQFSQLQKDTVKPLTLPVTGSKNSVQVNIKLYSPTITPYSFSQQRINVPVGTSPTKRKYPLPTFIPSTISPSNCGVLIECPRRFQYAFLWQVSGVREQWLRHEFNLSVNYPDGIASTRFGNLVHTLLETRDFSKLTQEDQKVLRRLDPTSGSRFARSLTDNQLKALIKTVSNFDSFSQFSEIQKALKSGKRLYNEYQAHAVLNLGAHTPIPVIGFIDLMVERTNGTWMIIDFKAEPKPPNNSFHERIHKLQLDGYAWLVAKSLGITVSQCALAYLYPKLEEMIFQPQPNNFAQLTINALQTLSMDQNRGLEAKPQSGPSGPCYLCPYRAKVGGPCEHAR